MNYVRLLVFGVLLAIVFSLLYSLDDYSPVNRTSLDKGLAILTLAAFALGLWNVVNPLKK